MQGKLFIKKNCNADVNPTTYGMKRIVKKYLWCKQKIFEILFIEKKKKTIMSSLKTKIQNNDKEIF